MYLLLFLECKFCFAFTFIFHSFSCLQTSLCICGVSTEWDSGHLLSLGSSSGSLSVRDQSPAVWFGVFCWEVLRDTPVVAKNGDTVIETTFWCERATLPAEDTHPKVHTQRGWSWFWPLRSLSRWYKSVTVQQVRGVSKQQRYKTPTFLKGDISISVAALTINRKVF